MKEHIANLSRVTAQNRVYLDQSRGNSVIIDYRKNNEFSSKKSGMNG